MMKSQAGHRGDITILTGGIWQSKVTALWAQEPVEHPNTAGRQTWPVTSTPGGTHSSYKLTPPPPAKDRAGLHPLGRQQANISLAITCVYVCINTYVYIGTYIGRFLIKSLWTLFLGQLKATDEEACFLVVIQLCTFSASGMLMRPALFKWAP